MKWDRDDWRANLQAGRWVDPADAGSLRELLCGQAVWLASGSPRRQEILKQCRVRFRLAESALVEPVPVGPGWRAWVRSWALRKARAGAWNRRSGVIIGADTIVTLHSQGLGKPANRSDAARMLRSLSGQIHQVYSGVAVLEVRTSRFATGSAVSQVHFRRLTTAEIERYVRSDEPLDKAGAYAIQGEGGRFVDRIQGPLDNIIGLPVACLTHVLARVIP